MTGSPDRETEEYEHIPWSHMTTPSRPPQQRLIFAGVAAVLGVLGGLGVARMLAADGEVDPQTSVTVAEAVPTPQDPRPAAAVPPIVPAPALYREADLLAVLPEEELRLAVMQAEWFVRDFFTVDGQPGAAASVRALLPAASGLALPHDDSLPVTYVEWARAFQADGSQPDIYDIDVAYRVLSEAEDGGFDRSPLRAVRIAIVRGLDGALAVGDLPMPVEPPAIGSAPSWQPPQEVPQTVMDEALSMLGGHGLEGTVVSGHRGAAGWRLIVEAGPPGTPPFPMVVHVDQP